VVRVAIRASGYALPALPAIRVVPLIGSSPSAPIDRRRPTAVELFSGAGGMALGFERAGFDILAAVDLDPVHLAAHEHNFPLCEPICDDVARLSAARIVEAAYAGWARRHGDAKPPTSVDCVFGGPSCQGFSVIGRRDPGDRRNELVHEFARLVLAIRPRWFVLENVPGLVSPAYESVLAKLRSDLAGGGYRVAEPWVLNASDHGVPQDRKRIFIVGARRDQPLPKRPAAASSKVTVTEALDDLPELARYRTLLRRDRLELDPTERKAIRERQSQYVLRLNGDAYDPADLSDPRRWDRSALTGVSITAHRADVVKRFRRLKAGARDDIGRLPKLDENGQSPTLRAGTGRDHGSFTSARPVHHRSARVITVREAARLHGFPDWFGFHTTRWHGFRQVGNAVPPPLAHAVAATVVAAAACEPARRIEPLALGERQLLAMPLNEAALRYGLPEELLPENVRRSKPASDVPASAADAA
jgi:DNA (cytosine-5)-methyltransferase 1